MDIKVQITRKITASKIKAELWLEDLDLVQKWLPLNYSFVCIEIASLTLFGITNSLQFLSQKRG